jgi:hypothetical protein
MQQEEEEKWNPAEKMTLLPKTVEVKIEDRLIKVKAMEIMKFWVSMAMWYLCYTWIPMSKVMLLGTKKFLTII